jgi:hypothetical protein
VPETYTPFTWADGSGGGTPITAARLNNIEQGIESMDDRVAALEAVGGLLNAVADFGAVPDGTTNNNTALDNAVAAALSQKKALYLPAGRYLRTTTWDCRGEGLRLFGDGPEKTVILEGMGNAPTLLFGDYGQHIHDLSTEAESTKGANSNSVEMHNAAYGVYERITLIDSGRGIYQPQVPADGSMNAMWSCTFSNWRILGYQSNAIWLSAYNGGNTGSIFSNFHISNNLSGSPVASSGPAIYVAESDEMVFTQINVEHGIIPGNAVEFNHCMDPVVNGLHFEGITLNGSDGAFVYCHNAVKLSATGTTVKYNTLPSGSGDKSYFLVDEGNCRLRVFGLHSEGNTLNATNRYFIRFGGSATNASVYATGITPADFTAWSSGDSTTVPMLKQFNNEQFHRLDGGKNVTWGTAAPASGTWAVGDVRWNTAPAAGGAPGWMCTTAGTPGTWKAMASLAA